MPVNEELLVKRAQKGDSTALEELIIAYEKRVYNIAYRFMGNEADAYDMAQDALIKMYRGVTSFKRESAFSSWVYRLTVNACMDGIRKRKHIPLSLEHSIEKGASYEDTENATPETHALSVERNRDIQKAINTLTVDHKSVIILRDIKGLSYEDISKCLDISVGTVKSRINRGRQKLKALLINE